MAMPVDLIVVHLYNSMFAFTIIILQILTIFKSFLHILSKKKNHLLYIYRFFLGKFFTY